MLTQPSILSFISQLPSKGQVSNKPLPQPVFTGYEPKHLTGLALKRSILNKQFILQS